MSKKINDQEMVETEDVIIDADVVDEAIEADEAEVIEKKENFIVRGAKKIWAHKKAIGIGILAFVGGVAAKTLMDKAGNSQTDDQLMLPDNGEDDNYGLTPEDETQDDVEITEF